MAPIEFERTLAELVLERPARTRVFEELQLDYCCGGGRSLAESAAERGLDVRTLAATLAVCAIFLPVVFMQGIIGKFFLQFGATLCIAVLL